MCLRESVPDSVERLDPVRLSLPGWTRLSCQKFRNNEVRLQLHALAYNLGNFMRTLALLKAVEHWSLTTGAKVVRHGRYITFQLAEVAIPRSLFANILRLIDGLRPAPLPP